MIAASSASAALVSILATMPARSPTTSRSATTSAARRTNDRRDVLDAGGGDRLGEHEVLVGRGEHLQPLARQVHAGPALRAAAALDLGDARRRRSTASTRSEMPPSPMHDPVAGIEVRRAASGSGTVIDVAAARARAGHQADALARRQVDAAVRERAGPDLRARAGRRARRPGGRRAAATSRTAASRCRWSSTGPWLRLSRTTSTPARTIASSRAGSSLAGPSVATIFVRRVTPAYLVARWSSCRSDRGLTPSPADATAGLRAYLDASPSPWHAVRTSAAAARRRPGSPTLDERAAWTDVPDAGYVARGGALIAWRRPPGAGAAARCTSSAPTPTRRACGSSPIPTAARAGWRQLGVEIYGGVLLNSWLDRDLGVAGRLVFADGSDTLVDVAEPIARVPQLAIHLDRDVNERGLVLDRQAHMTPVWATAIDDPVRASGSPSGPAAPSRRGGSCACTTSSRPPCSAPTARCWPAGGSTTWCRAGRRRRRSSPPSRPSHVAMIALFDHEEVGSASTTGASGPFLATVLERLHDAAGGGARRAPPLPRRVELRVGRQRPRRAPELPRAPRPRPRARSSTTARRSSSTPTSATPRRPTPRCCSGGRASDAGVPLQTFVSRNNMPCGSTIGPLTATRLGIATVDVGVPQLSMHSAREVCGAADPAWLAAALTSYLTAADPSECCGARVLRSGNRRPHSDAHTRMGSAVDAALGLVEQLLQRRVQLGR